MFSVAVGERSRQLGARVTRATSILRQDGPRALAQRVARYAYNKLDAASLDDPPHEDVADSARLHLALPERRPLHGDPLTIGWVMTPPSAGSGGHTTLFRMVKAAEEAGHRCVLFLHDRYGGDVQSHEQVIREWWPDLEAEVRDAMNGISDVDACVASSWVSAHVMARRGGSPMRRLYFVQDYEPYFYPRGALYALAEDSYRFGFRCIALGGMVAELLRSDAGVVADVVEFGCDTSVYRLLPRNDRKGIVFFARPDTPRRGYLLACLALQRFHELHPDVEIHFYGSRVGRLPFPATQHGRLTASELNELYNSCIAGLVLSFTNISLVPEEMLAAGTIPVMNDSAHSKMVLRNDNAVWAAPTPEGLAAALSDVVRRADVTEAARVASESVRSVGWARAQADTVRIIEDEVYGLATRTPN